MRFSPPSRRGLAARALALAPACAIVIGGLTIPAGASATGMAPTAAVRDVTGMSPAAARRVMAKVSPAAASRVTPDGKLVPLASASVIKPTVTAVGITQYDVTSGGLLSGIHKCVETGTDGTIEAIVCADLYAIPDPNGTIDVAPAMEAYCQIGDTTAIGQCENVSVGMFVARGDGVQFAESNPICTIQQETCPKTSRFTARGTLGSITAACFGTKTQDEVWTVIEAHSQITIQRNTITGTTSNLASQHALICG